MANTTMRAMAADVVVVAAAGEWELRRVILSFA
jgi:hypothetical protein